MTEAKSKLEEALERAHNAPKELPPDHLSAYARAADDYFRAVKEAKENEALER